MSLLCYLYTSKLVRKLSDTFCSETCNTTWLSFPVYLILHTWRKKMRKKYIRRLAIFYQIHCYRRKSIKAEERQAYLTSLLLPVFLGPDQIAFHCSWRVACLEHTYLHVVSSGWLTSQMVPVNCQKDLEIVLLLKYLRNSKSCIFILKCSSSFILLELTMKKRVLSLIYIELLTCKL